MRNLDSFIITCESLIIDDIAMEGFSEIKEKIKAGLKKLLELFDKLIKKAHAKILSMRKIEYVYIRKTHYKNFIDGFAKLEKFVPNLNRAVDALINSPAKYHMIN